MDMIISTSSTPSSNYTQTKIVIYTLLVYAVLVVVLFLKIINHASEAALQEDVIEVNLGDSDDGSGDIPPALTAAKGDDAIPLAQQVNTLPQPTPPTITNNTEMIESDDETIASSIKKEEKKNKPQPMATVKAKPAPEQSTPKVEKSHTPYTPTPQKPMAVFGGDVEGQTEGQASYDSYGKEGSSQGITQGKGDMGAKNGTLSSNNYGSVSVVGGLGNRKVTVSSSLKEEFSSEGTIQVKITFNRQGSVVSLVQDVANSTTTKKELVDIAFRHARKISLNEDEKASSQQVVTFRFIFKINL